ncbi:MAG: GNAT family N-acetyltransferase [Oscillospiraceae bacterium]|nr:GNAT family N-acetyltransferase [Oscillospiraceae bacterium]
MKGIKMVREADINDLTQVIKIVMKYREFYGVNEQDKAAVTQFIKARMENEQSKIFIAEEAGEVVGFIQLYPSYSTVSLKPQWILNDFFVDPVCREKGCGRKLMDFVKDYFSDKAKGFILVTDKTNHTANSFYDKNGWETGEYDFYTFFY